MATLLKVKKIGSSKYESNEYVALPLYLLRRTPNGEPEYACICRELYFVDDFTANMLIRIDIIGPEDIIINPREQTTYISSCAIILEIDEKQQEFFIRWKFLA